MAALEHNFNVINRNQRVFAAVVLAYLISAIASAVLGNWHLAFFLLIMWLGTVVNNALRTLMLVVIASRKA